MPRYACFVARPDEAGRQFVVAVHRMTRALDGDPYTDNATVALNLTYADRMTDLNTTIGKRGYSVRLSNDDATWSDWAFGLPSVEWDLAPGEGEQKVYCQVMDEAGLVSAVFNDTIVMDATAPTGSIVINGGDGWTTDLRVTLTLTYDDATSGVDGVRFGDEAVGGDEPWDNPLETKEWTLPEGDGASLVVAFQVRDAAGHMSEVYSASIGLDTAPPTGSIVINGGDTTATDSDATLSLTNEVDTSGVVEMRVSNDAIGGDEPWENPAPSMEWDLGETGGRVTVYYQVRDAAGLVSEVYSDDILLDMDTPTGTITLATGAMVTNTATIPLALTYTDATSNVVGIRVQEEAVGGDEPWDNPLESIEFQLSAGDGEKTIYYQVKDEAGHVSQVYTLSITLDTTNPYVDETDPDNGEAAVKVAGPIVVRFSEPMDPASVEGATRLYWVDKEGATHDLILTVTWSPDGRTMTLAPSTDLGEGTEHSLVVGKDAKDVAGNELFPEILYSFTTEGDGGGNGGNGDDGDDDSTTPWTLIAVVIVLVIAGMLFTVMYIIPKSRGPSA